MIHLGFSGTRHGHTVAQLARVRLEIDRLADAGEFAAHHGDCIGADAEFHDIVRALPGGRIVVHPSAHRLRAYCKGDETRIAKPPMRRNWDIVAESHALIAAPGSDTEDERSGTWATVRLARRAIAGAVSKTALLRELVVIGKDGQIIEQRSASK